MVEESEVLFGLFKFAFTCTILTSLLFIQANSQRHKHVNEQLDETQELIFKLFEHKEKFKNYLLMSTSKSDAELSKTQQKSTESAGYTTAAAKSTFKTKSFNRKSINTRSGQIKVASPARASYGSLKSSRFNVN